MEDLNIFEGIQEEYATKYKQLFFDHDIDQNLFDDLNHDILRELGIEKIGHRIKILKNVQNSKNKLLDNIPNERNNSTKVEQEIVEPNNFVIEARNNNEMFINNEDHDYLKQSIQENILIGTNKQARHHQWEAVVKILEDIKSGSNRKNYLIQHGKKKANILPFLVK